MPNNKANVKPFKLQYVFLPLLCLVVGIILAIVYMPQLDGEIALRFDADGQPTKYGSPWSATLLCVGAALVLAAICVFITRFIATREFLTDNDERVLVRPNTLLTLVGNIPGIASAVIIYAYFDICLYNTTGDHFLTLLVFTLIICGLSAVILAIMLVPPMLKSVTKDVYGVKKAKAEEEAALKEEQARRKEQQEKELQSEIERLRAENAELKQKEQPSSPEDSQEANDNSNQEKE